MLPSHMYRQTDPMRRSPRISREGEVMHMLVKTLFKGPSVSNAALAMENSIRVTNPVSAVVLLR